MPRYKVALGILAVGGQERVEVGTFRETAACCCAGRADMDLITIPIARVPTPVARNVLVKTAKQHGCDFLVMLDEDMGVPPDFFEAALKFLLAHPGPAAIGVPYCTAPPREDVLVFEHANGESGSPGAAWAITNVVREDAARRTGIEECANIGTGCIAYSMSFFDALTPPYFDYSCNEDHTQVIETEDCYCHRRAWQKGLGLFVHWDFWASHYKTKRISKPIPIGRDDVVKAFARDAQAVDRLAARGQGQPIKDTLSVRGNGCKVEYAAECSRVIPPCVNDPRYDGSAFTPAVAAEWAQSVEGWMHPDELLWLAEQAAKLKPGDVWVEVGAWKGRSTAAVVLAANKDAEINIVDTFEGSAEHRPDGKPVQGLREAFRQTMARLEKLRPRGPATCTLAVPSLEAAEKFSSASVAAVFLDAAHDYASVKADLEAWLPKVKPGGFIRGHDRNEEGVRRAVAEVLGNPLWEPGTIWLMTVPEAEKVAALGNGQKVTAEG